MQKAPLPTESFGEGISLMNGKIYQLTYQEGLCRVFDAATFKFVKDFTLFRRRLGNDARRQKLIMSNGSHIISYINPDTFQTERTIAVFDEKGKPLMDINELELIKGELWANVWHSENIGKPNHIAASTPPPASSRLGQPCKHLPRRQRRRPPKTPSTASPMMLPPIGFS